MALRLLGSGSGYIELKAPASAGDNTLTLPTNNGSANQLLKTDGSGNLSWTDDNSGVSLSGSTNNTIATVTGANALIGEANLTFDGNALRVGGATHGSHSSFSDIFLGGTSHMYAETTGAAGNSLSISQNAHVDSDGSWEYIVTDEASNIYQYSGRIGFRTAASGTAGNDISWEERLLITATGEILIGRSTKPNDINKLVVTGTSPADTYDSQLYLEGSETSGAAHTGGALAFGGHDNTAYRNWGNIYGMKENGTGGNTASYLSFHTREDGGNPSEKLRITSGGDFGTNGVTPTTQSGKVFHLHAGAYQQRLHMTNNTTGSSATDGFEIIVEESANVRIRNFEAGALMFDSGGSNNEAMRITSGGNILIGATSWQFAKALNVKSTSGSILSLYNSGTTSYAKDTCSAIEFKLLTGNTGNQSGAVEIRGFKENATNGDNARGIGFWTAGNGGTNSERFRITSGGILKSGAATLFGNAGVELSSPDSKLSISRASSACMLWNRTTSAGELVDIRYAWTGCGSISVDVNSTTYATSSDYRLKENIVEISDGITRLKTLKPSRFNWIGHAESTRDGFIAHEVTAVPEAITGTKDACYTEDDASLNIKTGDPKYQQIDQAKLVPLITAALKEAIAKIETLETKVAALESA